MVKDLARYELDSTLRYKILGDIVLSGEPALDPFDSFQVKQVLALLNHLPPDTLVIVAQHYLGTEYEGRSIGPLSDWRL